MAGTEVADGQFKPAVNLAKKIQTSQAAEIDTIKDLLG
jgi:uncharacterized protein (DUF305 family)